LCENIDCSLISGYDLHHSSSSSGSGNSSGIVV